MSFGPETPEAFDKVKESWEEHRAFEDWLMQGVSSGKFKNTGKGKFTYEGEDGLSRNDLESIYYAEKTDKDRKDREGSTGTGNKKADGLIDKMIESMKGDLKPGVVEEFRKELVEAIKEDYSESDLSKITAQDVSEIFDASIGSDNEKYFDVED